MAEFDSLNSAEFSYEKKGEGKNKLYRILLIIGYVLFVIVFFLACYLSKLIPAFAVAPIFLWMLIFFTWRLVKYDMYVEFQKGSLTLGRIKVRKSGTKRTPLLIVPVKSAEEIAPFDSSVSLEGSKVYDFSESPTSDKRIFIRFEKNGEKSIAIFEGTARLGKLLTSYSENAHDLKGKDFHG